MAISGDIEKLERRWTENPTGLMFAPLAEAYRKAGDPARALEILEQGLGQHPEYIPALIVKGRCGLDSESLAEAEAAFQRALARDPVNPIALRGVAEVYERTGRPDLAIERLELLLDVDRGDTDARDALARLRAEPNPFNAPAQIQFAAEPLPPAIEELEVQEPAVEEPAPATAPSQWAEWMPSGLNAPSVVEDPSGPSAEPVAGLVTNDSDGPFGEYLEVAKSEPPDAEARASLEPVEEAPVQEPAASKWSSWAAWRDQMSEAPASGSARADSAAVGRDDAAGDDADSDETGPEAIDADLADDAPVGWTPRALEPDVVEAELVEAEEWEAEGGATAPVADAVADAVEESTESTEWRESVEVDPLPIPVEASEVAEVPIEDLELVEDEADDEDDGEEAALETAWAPASVERPSATADEPIEFSLLEPEPEAEAIPDQDTTPEAEATVAAVEAFVSAAPDEERESPEDEASPEPEEMVAEAEFIVTESMAELFLRQGHRDLALAVYRQLVIDPEYRHLDEVIVRLELEAAQANPKPVMESEAAQPSAPARRYAAADTGGVAVPTFLREVLEAPPPATDSSILPPAIERGPAGEPTRDAGGPLSLADVFGEDAAAAQPAIAAEDRPHPAPASPASEEPSYDEFFGAGSGGDDMPAAVSTESEHLEQFNEWLRGLKR